MAWTIENLEWVREALPYWVIEDDREYSYITLTADDIIGLVSSSNNLYHLLELMGKQAAFEQCGNAEQTEAIEHGFVNILDENDAFTAIQIALSGKDTQFRYILDNEDFIHMEALAHFAGRLESDEDDVTDEEWGQWTRYTEGLQYLTYTPKDGFGTCEVTGLGGTLWKYTFTRPENNDGDGEEQAAPGMEPNHSDNSWRLK